MPFVLAIGVLVFLGAFVPMVGATVAGTVAVLVALVDQGPITALLMLGGVILVQQIEGHVLQPFLMGRFVSLHPLGVIVAIGVRGPRRRHRRAPWSPSRSRPRSTPSSSTWPAYTDPGDDPAEDGLGDEATYRARPGDDDARRATRTTPRGPR